MVDAYKFIGGSSLREYFAEVKYKWILFWMANLKQDIRKNSYVYFKSICKKGIFKP